MKKFISVGVTVLLALMLLPSALFSFMSMFPVIDAPHNAAEETAVTLSMLSGLPLFPLVLGSLIARIILLEKQMKKAANIVSLLPFIDIVFIIAVIDKYSLVNPK